MFVLAMHESFVVELNRAPHRVQNAVKRSWSVLQDHPAHPDPPKIKRLHGYRDLWRLRVSDSYRLVYRLHSHGSGGTITLLMLGDRQEVYDRLGANDDGSPGIRIVTDDLSDLIERDPTPEELIESMTVPAPKAERMPDQALPVVLTSERLMEWGVEPQYHDAFSTATTEGELLVLTDRVPPRVVEFVLYCLWPPTITEIVQLPVRIVEQPDDIMAVDSAIPDLDSFLLKLDDDQRSFVDRFGRNSTQGPWLLKGGPGSGKSVVALYCIRELIEREQGKLPGQRADMRILLTTYTNSLVNASRHLLKAIRANGAGTIRIDTLDKVVTEFLPTDLRGLKAVRTGELGDYARKAIAACRSATPSYSFTAKDAEYLLEEVDWVLVGQNHTTLESYVKADRSGRRRPLGRRQREHVWVYWEAVRESLRADHKCLFIERTRGALANALPTYDYVFIDEAQDLAPVAIRFAVALANPKSNVFITVDSNQSIYATGMSWALIAEELRFSGRTHILKRNYRTTHEIWDAVKQLAPVAEDPETTDTQPVFHGTWPVLVKHDSMSGLGQRLNRFIFESMREERVGTDSVAILCPTSKEIDQVIDVIDPRFRAKKMTSQNLAIDYTGVTVTTMHASKGLGFPIVAIVGADDGRLPWPASRGADPDEHRARQHRLLFVAGTRAMKRLLVAADASRPSPFLDAVTDDYWEIETV